MDDSSASSGWGYERAYHHHAHNGSLILISLAVLFFICIFIALFHWYAKRLDDSRRRYLNRVRSDYYLRRLVLPADNIILDYATSNKGLECCVLISLPTFQYDSAVNGGAPSECAVCLSEFQERELCRALPACNHAFHVDCIDMWFHSQSNCPICRAEVQPVKKPIESTTPIAELQGQ